MSDITKTSIIKAFNDNNIEAEKIAIGFGNTLPNNKRYKFRVIETYKKNNSVLFVVKYIKDRDICIVWKNSGKSHSGKIISRNIFSIKSDIVNAVDDNEIVTKWVEFVNGNKEIVLICTLDSLRDNLKKWLYLN
ncbi:MAG: hypothetical protein IJT49_00775 [Clostridia bacterium]|nr:hypothetical protein [Clostridia bacterium]